MAETPAHNRPLSPHLGIYRPMLTMMMSIVHRITGGALYVGTLLLAWWLVAAATGPEAYAAFQDIASSWIGRLVLFGYTWALIHHLLGGVRHFVWDLGKGFELGTVEWMARLSLAGSILLTIVVWVVAYAIAGAP
ncbi:MAG: succinate dehydrogenase, cytochrome b556 subunit [Parvibaculaceae bacterium]